MVPATHSESDKSNTQPGSMDLHDLDCMATSQLFTLCLGQATFATVHLALVWLIEPSLANHPLQIELFLVVSLPFDESEYTSDRQLQEVCFKDIQFSLPGHRCQSMWGTQTQPALVSEGWRE